MGSNVSLSEPISTLLNTAVLIRSVLPTWMARKLFSQYYTETGDMASVSNRLPKASYGLTINLSSC